MGEAVPIIHKDNLLNKNFKVLVEVDCIVLLLTVPMVFGRERSSFTLQDSSNSMRYAVIAQPLWAWAMAAIKTSVAFMLLRLEQEIPWRRFLWIMIAIQGSLGLYNMIAQLMQCIPLHAAWDLLRLTEAKCWSADAIRINIIITSSINIMTDFIFALLPISFLRKVQRPLRERIVIGVLMALGIFTGVASIMKMVSSITFGRTGDPSAEGIQIGMWSCIEEFIGLIAACVPCLRSPFQQILEYIGVVSSTKAGTGRNYGHVYGASAKPRVILSKKAGSGSASVAIKMKSIRSRNSQSEENILMTGDETKSGEIWCTTEVRLEEEKMRQVTRNGPKIGVPEPSWSGDSATRSH
jgi:hypothetical protein